MIIKRTANTVNMVELLEKLNEPLKKVGKSKRWTHHPSIAFKDNLWFRHSTKQGGLPVDFLMTFFNYSEQEAIQTLAQLFELTKNANTDIDRKLYRPPKNSTTHTVEIYLKHFRLIDEDLISYFIEHGLLYEERKYKNCIFIGKDNKGIPRHLHRHSTHLSNMIYKGNVPGSDSRFPFNMMNQSESLFIFESPIDLMSYITLNKDNWKEHSYLALCGLSSQSIHQVLQDNPHIKTIHLCLDNDIPGQAAIASILDELQEHHSMIIKVITPRFKDFNEDLKFMHGLPVIQGVRESFIQFVEDLKVKIVKNYEKSKDKSIKDLMNVFSIVYYGYNSDLPKQKKKSRNALIDCAGHALLLARQQYRHLEKTYSIQGMVDLIKYDEPFMKYCEQDSKLTGFTKDLDVIKTLFLTKHYHTVDDKHQLIQSLMSLAKRCTTTHVFLSLNKQNERNTKQ